jgi:porphyrinogen peroxidase
MSTPSARQPFSLSLLAQAQKAGLSTLTARSIMSRRTPIESQRVDAPLTSSATFLTFTVSEAPGALDIVRSTLASIDDLTKNVSIRDLDASFACTVGIGSMVWDKLLPNTPRPAELHPFAKIEGKVHTAVSTPGDLLFHIRAQRRDLCFEFERQLMDMFGDSVKIEDSTQGFRYFDTRDLLGFVDGTANPTGTDIHESTLVTESDDSNSAGGSYLVVQKYRHNLDSWKALGTEKQEKIIGRTKFDNIELDDQPESEQKPHKQLANIEDPHGDGELAILRDNMPFGDPSKGEFGTYFIGYSRRLWVIEKMLERMFVGSPPGMHDRILDYSKAVMGCTFFVPSATVLAGLGD